MSTPIAFPGHYEQIVTIADIANPDIKWRATFTFGQATPPVSSSPICTAINTFVLGLIWPDSQIVEFSVYDWVRGRQPYPSGSPLFSVTSAAPGTANVHWPHLATPHHPTGGEVVLRIDRLVAGPGKPGRLFARGLLGMDDLSSISGGKWSLVPSLTLLQGDLNALVTSSGLNAFINVSTSVPHLCVVRHSKFTTTLYDGPVFQLEAIGVTTSKQTRKNPR